MAVRGRADAEAVLDELAVWIADTKSGYGRSELLEQIARLRARHRVGEDLLDRVIRLYGGPVALLRHLAQITQNTGELPAVVDEGSNSSAGKVDVPRHTTTERGHDGREQGHGAAVGSAA